METRVYTYVGKRITTDKKLKNHFLDPEGKEVYLVKSKAILYPIGTQFKEHEKGGIDINTRVGFFEDKERVAQWEMLSGSHTVQYNADRDNQKLGQYLDKDIAKLRSQLDALPGLQKLNARYYIITKLFR